MASGTSKKTKPRSDSSKKSKRGKKRNKFGAIRVGQFGSQVEARRFAFLEQLQRGGAISDLQAHPTYVITPDFWPVIKFIPDAGYVDTKGSISGVAGARVIEDTKGMITDVFRLKVKLFRGKYPTYKVFVVKSKRGQWAMEDFSGARRKKS